MLQSLDIIRAIAAARTNEVVVTTMTSIFQWDDVVGDDPLHLPLIGSMSKASSLALGVAIARPDRQVICLDGDGSLLMNLGTLTSIVASKPKNLIHIVFENNAYNITGGQPIPGAGGVDFAGIAKAVGIANTATFSDLDSFKAAWPGILAQQGPTFICIKTVPAGPQPKIQHGRMRRAMARITEELAKQPA